MNQKDATSLPTLRISSTDHERLRLLVESMIQIQPRLRETLKPLSTELERAEVVPAAVMPANIARMGSQVEIEDQESGDVDVYTLRLPGAGGCFGRTDLDSGAVGNGRHRLYRGGYL